MRKLTAILLLLPALARASQIVNPSVAGTPGGSTTQVQYNNASAFAGSANFVFYGSSVSVSGGVVGTATNNNAAVGIVGETVSATYSGVSITNGQWGDGTSIILTAGDWLVTHVCVLAGGAATAGQGQAGISATSGNSATGLTVGDNEIYGVFAALLNTSIVVPDYRMSLSGTNTVYAKINNGSTGGTPVFYGRISAVRIR